MSLPPRTTAPTPPPLLIAGMAVAALALIPLGFVVVYAVLLGPAEAWALLWRPRIGLLVSNTLRLLVIASVASVVLGVSAAWVVERSDLPGRRLVHGLLVAPLAVPAFVNSYGWVSLTHSVQSFAGACLVLTLSYYPLVYLPTVAALRGLDPALEETAWTLNRSPWRTFTDVVLPQLRPAILGGCLLVSIHLLAEFGALQMLSYPTFTTAIYDQYTSTFNGPAATMIAGVLVLFCLALLLGELTLRGHARYARLGRGAARRGVPVALGPWRWPTFALMLALITLALGVPLYALTYWLLTGTSRRLELISLVEAAGTSVGLGAVAAVVTTLMALPVCWLVVRYRGPAATLIERSTYVATSLPAIVVALALVSVSIQAFPAIYQTWLLLVAAYAILFLPRAVVTVRAALEQAPPVLDDVAYSLGLSPLHTVRRVVLPAIAPGLGAGAALVFLACATELTATLMLSPIGTTTLATEFWAKSSSVQYAAAAPYALLLVAISIPATIMLSRQARAETPLLQRVPELGGQL